MYIHVHVATEKINNYYYASVTNVLYIYIYIYIYIYTVVSSQGSSKIYHASLLTHNVVVITINAFLPCAIQYTDYIT